MLYSDSDTKRNIDYISNYYSNTNIDNNFREIIRDISFITLSTFNNGPYKINDNVRIINLTDEDKKDLNGTVCKVKDIYIGIDKKGNIYYEYLVASNALYIVKIKNLEKVKESKLYIIEGNYCDKNFYFYIKKINERFIATNRIENATVFTEEDISFISLNNDMPLVEDLSWNFVPCRG